MTGPRMAAPLWIAEAEVAELLSMAEAIEALEQGLRLEADGAARTMVKTHVEWGDGHTLHAIGATMEGRGLVGAKVWAHTEGGATPILVLWHAETGGLAAIVEAFALGQLRTGGMTGVATRLLAAADADELAQIGSGRQALPQVAAVAAVRPLRRIRVFSPTTAHAEAMAADLRAALPDTEIVLAANPARCVEGAAIVNLATRAREPFLRAAMLAPGTHLNAVGAITPEREEFAQDVFGRAGLVAVDSLPQIRRLSREFITWFGTDDAAWDVVRPLSQLVRHGIARPPDADLTLFKAMGIGLADLALGARILDLARRLGKGRSFTPPQRVPPRLWPVTSTL
ncbi:ornithine cyclodeaminase family protein [Inquilinus sp. CA228]|uniref:ornithine cyclodeaminase family protein n=1 Tax=Inquilinus sp. CA228 TaxID=3455609 RepID=UPI003F8D15EB